MHAAQEESGGELQEPGSPAWAADSSEQFADIAASLYTDEAHWHLAQAHGKHQLNRLCRPYVCIRTQRSRGDVACLNCYEACRNTDAGGLLRQCC